MASIQRRVSRDNKVSYRVQVRVRGHESVGATFKRKTDAKDWASQTTAAIKEGRYFPHKEAERHTVEEAIEKYLEEVMPNKKPSTQASQRLLLAWWEREIGRFRLSDVTAKLLTNKRRFLKSTPGRQGKPRSNAICNRYMSSFSHVFTVSKREWGWVQMNPFTDIKKLPEPRGRVRYLDRDERKRLLEACLDSGESALYGIVVLAISSGMRRGEVLGLEWRHVHFDTKQIVLFDTKNDEIRSVPMVGLAHAILEKRSKIRRLDTPLVFPGKKQASGEVLRLEFRTAWGKVLQAAEIEDFRFHDLRHCCASYLAQQGCSPLQIAEVLGHKTLEMVKRYSHLSPVHTRGVVEQMNAAIFGDNPDEGIASD